MPKIYRAMEADNGRPTTGTSATTLGVRVGIDISPDPAGQVNPGTGGMSVSPSLRDLPHHRIPARLRHLVPGARGRDTLFVWSMGEGPFIAGPVASSLQLRLDPKNSNHGFVEPDVSMSLDGYQQALYATRDAWSIDEAQ